MKLLRDLLKKLPEESAARTILELATDGVKENEQRYQQERERFERERDERRRRWQERYPSDS